MLKIRLKILTALMLILFANNLQAQNIEAFTKIDTNAISIGDQIGLELGIKLPLEFTAVWPTITDTITKNIEVISSGNIDTIFDKKEMILTQKLTITSFDSGYFEIPGMEFLFGKSGDSLMYSSKAKSLFLNVYTPEVDTSQAFKVIKAPFSEPYTFMEIFPWVLGGILIIGLIIFLFWFIKRRKKNQPIFAAKPKPLLPPEVVALEKLETLRLSKVWQQGLIKKYHSQITDIVREYLDRRFNFDAPEMTSEEIIEELKNHKINEEALAKVSSAFKLSDFVKFAKAQPTALENDLSISHCVDFINETAFSPETEVNKEEQNKIEGGTNV